MNELEKPSKKTIKPASRNELNGPLGSKKVYRRIDYNDAVKHRRLRPAKSQCPPPQWGAKVGLGRIGSRNVCRGAMAAHSGQGGSELARGLVRRGAVVGILVLARISSARVSSSGIGVLKTAEVSVSRASGSLLSVLTCEIGVSVGRPRCPRATPICSLSTRRLYF